MSAILNVLPMRRGRSAALPGAMQCLQLFPPNCKGRSRIYAIAFKGGIVKVGKTNNPRTRLRDHWARGNGEVEWVHLFAPMHERTARAVEMDAPAVLSAFLHPVNASEWFRGSTDRDRILPLLRACIDKCRAEVAARMNREAEDAATKHRALAVLKAAGIHDVSMYSLHVVATKQAA